MNGERDDGEIAELVACEFDELMRERYPAAAEAVVAMGGRPAHLVGLIARIQAMQAEMPRGGEGVAA